MLYDVTTLYFESSKSDDLRDFGFSKDCKINEVQIVLGLLVDLEGRPIGFDIFPGNTFEGHTLRDVIYKVNNRFNIRKLIFIGDQAMLSRKNLLESSNLTLKHVPSFIGHRKESKDI